MSTKKFKRHQLQAIITKKDGKLVAIASDESVDRTGDKLDMSKWDLKNFKKNPVLLAGHNYSIEAIIGKVKNLTVKGKELLFEPVFHDITTLAQSIDAMFEGGWANTFSVGYINHFKRGKDGQLERGKDGQLVHISMELLEISAVAVPANPNARVVDRKSIGAIKNWMSKEGFSMDHFDRGNTESKGAIPHKKHSLAEVNARWKGPREVAKATIADLLLMATWFDPEKADVKGSYKLPHHLADSPHQTVFRGVVAAMGALLGARGGVDIPDADRRKVYSHLAKHYREFDKVPPEFRMYAPEETKFIKDLYKNVDSLDVGKLQPKGKGQLPQPARKAHREATRNHRVLRMALQTIVKSASTTLRDIK